MAIMETTTADFWIDPSCPWSVMTASWLAEVQRERGIDVRWHAMSLALLNEGNEIPEEWAQFTADSWGPVRVLAAADERFEPDRVGPSSWRSVDACMPTGDVTSTPSSASRSTRPDCRPSSPSWRGSPTWTRSCA